MSNYYRTLRKYLSKTADNSRGGGRSAMAAADEGLQAADPGYSRDNPDSGIEDMIMATLRDAVEHQQSKAKKLGTSFIEASDRGNPEPSLEDHQSFWVKVPKMRQDGSFMSPEQTWKQQNFGPGKQGPKDEAAPADSGPLFPWLFNNQPANVNDSLVDIAQRVMRRSPDKSISYGPYKPAATGKPQSKLQRLLDLISGTGKDIWSGIKGAAANKNVQMAAAVGLPLLAAAAIYASIRKPQLKRKKAQA